MHPINVLTSHAVPLDRPNVDTDQIIPKQFLKRIERTGYGDFLFYDWRRIQDGPNTGQPDETFVLNKHHHKGAKILIAGKNFGCGSSREHAAWALTDFGFLAVIAPSFADIFFSNAGKNGMILVRVSDTDVQTLMERSEKNPAHKITINLEAQTITDDEGFSAHAACSREEPQPKFFSAMRICEPLYSALLRTKSLRSSTWSGVSRS